MHGFFVELQVRILGGKGLRIKGLRLGVRGGKGLRV